MSRTVKEIRIIAKKSDEIRKFIENWFSENGFVIKEQFSKKKWLYVFSWLCFPGVLLSPHKGAIVAVRIEIYGCIVFEISLQQDQNDTLLHGEFYVAGQTFMIGREWDLRPISPITAKIARQDGHDTMVQFIESLESISSI